MAIRKVKGIVSRKPIHREINKARKKLTRFEKRAAAPGQHDAILRHKLQLDLCEAILDDLYIIDG